MMATKKPAPVSVEPEKYVVLKAFTDLHDDNHVYYTGDAYPRIGYKPTAERIAELSGTKNKRNEALIKKA